MKTVLVQPFVGTSILMSAGKDLASVSGLINKALDVVHQINMTAEPLEQPLVRQKAKEMRTRQVNVGLVRDLEMHLGRAVIHTDCRESIYLSQLALLVTNFKRGLQDKYRISSKPLVESEGKSIVSALLPESEDEWQKATIQQAIKKYKGVNAFFQAVADHVKMPIVTAFGTSKQRLIKEELRPYLDATKFRIYGGNHLTDKQIHYACVGFEEVSEEVYQFIVVNKSYTRELIKLNLSDKIQELTLQKPLSAVQTIAKDDTDSKKANRFIPCDFPHLQIKACVRRRAYWVISNSQRNNKYQLPANTVYQSQQYIEQFLANSDAFSNFDLSCFFDKICCDPLTSLLNTILYLGRE